MWRSPRLNLDRRLRTSAQGDGYPGGVQGRDDPGAAEGDEANPDDLRQHADQRRDEAYDSAEDGLHRLQQVLGDLVEEVGQRRDDQHVDDLLPERQTVER